MSHGRQQIRDQVKTTLTGLATTGANVFTNRVYRFDEAELPALYVHTPAEDSEVGQMGPTPTLHRTLTIEVEGYAADSSAIADTLDTIAAEVEAAIGADTTLGGRVMWIAPVRTEINFTGDGEAVTGSVRITFEAVYVTTVADPETLG